MDFPQKTRPKTNENNYHIENLHKARDFSKNLILEMKELVKSIVLFGSNTNDTNNKNSDIDIMIILDNVSVFVTPELREAYRIITNKLSNEISSKFHIMTVNLTDLWDMARKGDPLLINILRYGTALFDRDIIEPLQYLLEIGKIKPSKETAYNYIARSKTLHEETEKHVKEAILDLYYSIIDISHASLISVKITPTSPKEIPKTFKKTFKNNKKILKHSEIIEEFYTIAKSIEHHNKIEISGKLFDNLNKKALKTIKELESFCKENLEKKEFEY
jgi:predicted nucleotidyltransferase/uncharacterized protein (UPF0332 family)